MQHGRWGAAFTWRAGASPEAMRCWCQFSHGIFFFFLYVFLAIPRNEWRLPDISDRIFTPLSILWPKKVQKSISKYSFWLEIETDLRLDCIFWRVLLRLREITLWFVRIILKTFVHGRVAKLIFGLWTSEKSSHAEGFRYVTTVSTVLGTFFSGAAKFLGFCLMKERLVSASQRLW